MPVLDPRAVCIRVIVTVYLDPTNEELLDAKKRLREAASAADVVRAEIESNLESVSYVHHVSVA